MILAKELTNGVGFFLISGLDPRQYSNETNVLLYLGISSYIGEKRGRQDELGNMLRMSPSKVELLRPYSFVAPVRRVRQLTRVL